MSVELVMPKAGLTMIEGTIATWKVEDGAAVKKGDVVMEFENEKTTMECEANADGFIKILAQVGDVVKVGEAVAIIAESKDEASATKAEAPQEAQVPSASVDASEVVMPKAGLTMIEGVVGEWKVAEGETVKKGQAIFEFENEKTTMECEATADGILHQVAKTGETVKVGHTVAYVAATKEAYDALIKGATPGSQAMCANECEVCHKSVALAMAEGAHQGANAVATDGHVRATGLARNIAKSAGISLTLVGGTGPNGRIVAKDVYAYLEAAKEAPIPAPEVKNVQPSGEVVKISLSGRRKSIAKNMRKCFETMAPLTVFAEVDVTDLMAMRQKYVDKAEVLGCKISMNDMLMLATVKMLKKHPMLNSTFDGETISSYPYVNLGMAVGLAEGLVVPVLKNADQYSLLEMSKALRDLALRAKDDTLVGGEQSGATFTVTNVGMYHIDFGTPVISPPQVGILGFGTAKKKFVEYKGEFCPRTMMHMMLTFDHRVFDGREAGEVLGDMKQLLENPELIFV